MPAHASRRGISEHLTPRSCNSLLDQVHSFGSFKISGAGTLWYLLRIAINLTLLLTRMRRTPSVSLASATVNSSINDEHFYLETLRSALLGEKPRQFASLLGNIHIQATPSLTNASSAPGAFLFPYRLIYNSLPLQLSPPWASAPQTNNAGPMRTQRNRIIRDLESVKVELEKFIRRLGGGSP